MGAMIKPYAMNLVNLSGLSTLANYCICSWFFVPLKVKWWRQHLGVWDKLLLGPVDSAIDLVDLNSDLIGVGVGTAGFANSAFSDCCERLSDSVGYTTKNLNDALESIRGSGLQWAYGVGDHGREHWY